MILYPAFPRGVVISIALLSGTQVVPAQEASSWETVPHGAARLIAGETHTSRDSVWLRAGVEIRLDPGWHTYWRYPGDSGVPPTFDFALNIDVRTLALKDDLIGNRAYEAVQNSPEGKVTTIDYNFPKPGTTEPVPKQTLETRIGNQGCGVTYYK